MQRLLSFLVGLIALGAVVTQYFLMIENRIAPVGETTIRFFSFFTILTNSLVAVYFMLRAMKVDIRLLCRPGILSAITTYITVVGIVYQVALRHIWRPTGLQMVVDELLHTIIPIAVIVYWWLYEDKSMVTYNKIGKWLLYPLIYLVYILLRGSFSDFYPYPFVDVTQLGLAKVLFNSVVMTCVFLLFSASFVGIGRVVKNKR